MSDWHGKHRNVAYQAIVEVDKLLTQLRQVSEQLDVAGGLVVLTVGVEPECESGQNAKSFAVALADRLVDTTAVAFQLKAELERYANGF